MTKGEPRMKKLFSILLAFVLVAGVFAPVGLLPEMPKAEAAAPQAQTFSKTNISTLSGLDMALSQAYDGMYLQLTADIKEMDYISNVTITPDMWNYDVTLDLNGYDIIINDARNSDGLFNLNSRNSSFHIMNSAYDGTAATVSKIETYMLGDGIISMNEYTASCYIYPGVLLTGRSEYELVTLNAFDEFKMYDSDITVVGNTSKCDCIYIGNNVNLEQSVFELIHCDLTATNGDCIDMRDYGTFVANKNADNRTFILNHTNLNIKSVDSYAINLSDAQNKNSTVKLTDIGYIPDLAYVEAMGVENYNTFNAGGLIQDFYAGACLYFRNGKLASLDGCDHSDKTMLLATATGHVMQCNKNCKAIINYTSHLNMRNYKAPTASAQGNTAGIDCTCGYQTFYCLPANKAPGIIANVKEIATWNDLYVGVRSDVANPVVLRLTADIEVEDHTKAYTLYPSIRGDLVIDLNGHHIDINSNATKNLVQMYNNPEKGKLGTRLIITDSTAVGTDTNKGYINLNTTKADVAMIYINHEANSLSVIYADLYMAKTGSTFTDSTKQTNLLEIGSFHKIDLYHANLVNNKENGNGIIFTTKDVSTARSKASFNMDYTNITFKTFGIYFNTPIRNTTFNEFNLGQECRLTPQSTSTGTAIYASAFTGSDATVASILRTNIQIVNASKGIPVGESRGLRESNIFASGVTYFTDFRPASCAHTEELYFYTADKHFSRCAACKAKMYGDNHSWSTITPASCVTTGIKSCNCGVTEIIPMSGCTNLTFVKGTATCQKAGTLDHYECSDCGKLYKDANANTELAPEDIISSVPSLFHDITRMFPATDPTCTTHGVNHAFGLCKDCQKTFIVITTINHGKPVIKQELLDRENPDHVTPALGHDYVNGSCSRCGEKEPIAAYIKGDVDGNGKVDAGDARLALRASVGLDTLNDVQQKAADVDGTVGVSSSDARLILRVSVGLEAFN